MPPEKKMLIVLILLPLMVIGSCALCIVGQLLFGAAFYVVTVK